MTEDRYLDRVGCQRVSIGEKTRDYVLLIKAQVEGFRLVFAHSMFVPLFTVGVLLVLATILACNAEIVESFLDLRSTEFDFVIVGGRL